MQVLKEREEMLESMLLQMKKNKDSGTIALSKFSEKTSLLYK